MNLESARDPGRSQTTAASDVPVASEVPVWKETAERVAHALNADVYLYNGRIERQYDRQLFDHVRKWNRRPNVLFILVTTGGDADAAYRMARCLQLHYQRVIVFVPGFCKSAGTVVLIGAHELVMSDQGELGPLDVQMQKTDELFEMSSGLTVMEAIRFLEERAHLMLEETFLRIKTGSGGQITFRTASDIAVSITTGLLEPISKQIDPMHLGEAARAMNIARDYGQRLVAVSKNLKGNALNELVAAFSSHGFVIDRAEAADRYFENVRPPTEDEEMLADLLSDLARWPMGGEQPMSGYLTDAITIRPEGLLQEDADGGEADETGTDPRGNGGAAPTLARARRNDPVTDEPPERHREESATD